MTQTVKRYTLLVGTDSEVNYEAKKLLDKGYQPHGSPSINKRGLIAQAFVNFNEENSQERKTNETIKEALKSCDDFMGGLTTVGGAGVRKEDMNQFTTATDKLLKALKLVK